MATSYAKIIGILNKMLTNLENKRLSDLQKYAVASIHSFDELIDHAAKLYQDTNNLLKEKSFTAEFAETMQSFHGAITEAQQVMQSLLAKNLLNQEHNIHILEEQLAETKLTTPSTDGLVVRLQSEIKAAKAQLDRLKQDNKLEQSASALYSAIVTFKTGILQKTIELGNSVLQSPSPAQGYTGLAKVFMFVALKIRDILNKSSKALLPKRMKDAETMLAQFSSNTQAEVTNQPAYKGKMQPQ